MSVAIRLADVGKQYVKYEDVPLLLSRALRFRAGNRRTRFWAVRHVDLEVGQGETIGVIGRNGAGKSTSMRLLAGVTAPSEGVVTVRGRVAPLISVGVGFHPELTGRENVYVNGTVLGMRRREIDALFDHIVSFAELENFIDTPVKFYSSGMFVRLGFAVAVAARPDVLLVDEVLAVGDMAFQSKCFDRMAEMQRDGTSIVIVSHNINAVRHLSSRVLVMREGSPVFLGSTAEGIAAYHQILASGADGGEDEDSPVDPPKAELLDGDGQPTAYVQAGEDLHLRAQIRFRKTVENPIFAVRILTERNQVAYSELLRDARPAGFAEGSDITCDVRLKAELATGSYRVYFSVAWTQSDEPDVEIDARRRSSPPIEFFVAGRPFVKGIADLKARFEL